MSGILSTVSCLDGYDPDSLRVDKARDAIRSCLSPVKDSETVEIRKALGRVLGQEIVPAIDVPAQDNSAMDGYAVCLSEKQTYQEVGTAFAGRKIGKANGVAIHRRVVVRRHIDRGNDVLCEHAA